MRSYETARTLFGFLEFVAWAVVVLGVVAGLLIAEGMSRDASGVELLIAALPGVAISLFGLIFVAIIQTARATVDSAEYTQQMLKIARDQLEISLQVLRGSGQQVSGFAKVAKEPGNQTGFNASDFETQFEEETPTDKGSAAITSLAASALSAESETIMHMGQKISLENESYQFGGGVFDSLALARTEIEKTFSIHDYEGMKVRARDGKYECDFQIFESFEEATKYIDKYNADV